MKAVMMVANRDVTLRTLFGSKTFKKDEPALVAPQLVKDALAIGILPVDGKSPIKEEPESEKEPIDQASRTERVRQAIEAIYDANDPDEFTTGATPKLKSVAKRAGLKKVSIKEVKDILTERNEAALKAEMEAKAKQAKKKPAEDPPDNDL